MSTAKAIARGRCIGAAVVVAAIFAALALGLPV